MLRNMATNCIFGVGYKKSNKKFNFADYRRMNDFT